MKTESILYALAGVAAGYALSKVYAQPSAAEPAAVGRNKYVHVSAYRRKWPSIGAVQYGNCQCSDGSMCVGKGNCECCTNKGGRIQVVITPRPVAMRTAPAMTAVSGGLA